MREPPDIGKIIPPGAFTIINEFVVELYKIDRDLISGIYLTGSMSLADFRTDKSDIDFLVLCNELPNQHFRRQIAKVHSSFEKKFATKLNGSYITFEALNIRNSAECKTLSYLDSYLTEIPFDMAAVTLYELKTTAITLSGTQAQKLPLRIELKDVNEFLFKNINTYWKGWIARHSSFTSRGVLLFLIPRLTEWVILGLARQLFTLRTGEITSKTNAGSYCLEHLGVNYHAIIKEAIEIRNNDDKHLLILKSSYYLKPSVKRYYKTIECANYLLKLFNEEYHKKQR
jgi:hypothetical protein